MINQDAIILTRFFEAIQALKERKYCNLNTFCLRYGIDRRNLYKVKADPTRQIFKPSWLTYLVEDYNVNAHWLLTGSGDIFM